MILQYGGFAVKKWIALLAAVCLVGCSPKDSKNVVTDLGGGVKMVMVWVPAGSFQMGSDDLAMLDGQPKSSVTISKPFWIGKTEVTQAQYKRIMGTSPSYFQGSKNPVEKVRWDDAMEFCKKLTERERLAGRLPEGCEYTLPTEAQWEYACRAGAIGPGREDLSWEDTSQAEYARLAEVTGEYATPAGSGKAGDLDESDDEGGMAPQQSQSDGVTYHLNTSGDGGGMAPPQQQPGRYDLNAMGWYSRNAGNKTHPVARKRPNAWGLYDMHGNVWEWCLEDWYEPDSGNSSDGSARRVRRGGSFSSSFEYCFPASRISCKYLGADDRIGFRVCLVPVTAT